MNGVEIKKRVPQDSSSGDVALSRNDVWRMFDRIALRYDLLNRLLSFGQDMVWRRKMSNHLSEKPDQNVLDVATGTGDVLLSMIKNNRNIRKATGVDRARNMLRRGLSKTAERDVTGKICFIEGDAAAIPARDGTYDAVTIAFGIRNVTDVPEVLGEMLRILKKGGRAVILEFSLPGNSVIRSAYLCYFRYILPVAGSLISGDKHAYRYLNRTVESFPYGKDFREMLLSSGFHNVCEYPLTFGIATIYCGDKP